MVTLSSTHKECTMYPTEHHPRWHQTWESSPQWWWFCQNMWFRCKSDVWGTYKSSFWSPVLTIYPHQELSGATLSRVYPTELTMLPILAYYAHRLNWDILLLYRERMMNCGDLRVLLSTQLRSVAQVGPSLTLSISFPLLFLVQIQAPLLNLGWSWRHWFGLWHWFLGLYYRGRPADAWALGCTLYCMAFGRYPFVGDGTFPSIYDEVSLSTLTYTCVLQLWATAVVLVCKFASGLFTQTACRLWISLCSSQKAPTRILLIC